ncbi:hypothetical protein ACWC5I_40610, partial [Kitasatospora sp. NPDC001574]
MRGRQRATRSGANPATTGARSPVCRGASRSTMPVNPVAAPVETSREVGIPSALAVNKPSG